MRVLIVDDSDDTAVIMSKYFHHVGHEARTAQNGKDALRLFTEFEPEVVLLDLCLPEMDGYEVLREIRRDPALRDLRVVALTAFARAEDRTRALNAGFQTHIAKPVTAAELIAVVRSLGRLHAARDTDPA